MDLPAIDWNDQWRESSEHLISYKSIDELKTKF